jgi:adenosine deaminase
VLHDDLGFGEQRLALLAANSIESSFLDDREKTRLLEEIESVEP